MPQSENASLLQILKRIAREERESADLCDFLIGTVTKANPLKIKISQKIELDEDFLVLCRNVTDYKVELSVDWATENKGGGAGEAAFASHNHDIKGKKEVTVHNALKKGDKVLLVMANGGQVYYVIDKVVI